MKSNQSILKDISPEYSLEGLMLKLKLQYFGHLMRTADSLEKTLMLGKIEGRRRRGQQRIRWLDGITDSIDIEFEQAPGVDDGQGSLACCSPWGHRVGHDCDCATTICFLSTKIPPNAKALTQRHEPSRWPLWSQGLRRAWGREAFKRDCVQTLAPTPSLAGSASSSAGKSKCGLWYHLWPPCHSPSQPPSWGA